MHRLINEIIIALENKEYCTALFMDIEKAFDKINHESLLETIRKQFRKKYLTKSKKNEKQKQNGKNTEPEKTKNT